MVKKLEEKKALFIQRFIAFLIDFLIITTIASLVATPFSSKNNTKYSERIVELQQKIMNNEISTKDYILEYSDITYSIARNNGILALITILFNICYFVIYQIKMNGQTLGKKIMNIQVVSEDGDLFMNQMLLRCMLANFILMDIVSFMFMLFLPKSIYLYGVLGIEMIQYLFIIISAFFVMFRKDGRSIHDLLLHTKVVRV